MGQENQPEPKQPLSTTTSRLTSARHPPSKCIPTPQRTECPGVLMLKTTPFKKSVQIQTQTELLFMEQVETTLRQLLENRLHTNKLFLLSDLQKLIESLTFTLADLQQQSTIYRDINAQNIFYDGSFKLLPNQLIPLTSYQKLKIGQCVCPSPEMIIALRCGQQTIEQIDILQKSNVFVLGMMLLQVATLLPSASCYDQQNYDIIDSSINERIIMVEEYYNQSIARIIANMLDYDYGQRMGFRQLSIWINRQLQASRDSGQMTGSVLGVQSQKNEKVQERTIGGCSGVSQKSNKKLTKNNSVYMNYTRQEPSKDQRNKIYVNEQPTKPTHSMYQQHPSRQNNKLYQQPKYQAQNTANVSKLESILQRTTKPNNTVNYHQQYFNDNDSFKFQEPQKNELKYNNPYCQNINVGRQYQRGREKQISRKTGQNKSYQPYLGHHDRNQKEYQHKILRNRDEPLRQINNEYYPNVNDIIPKGSVQMGDHRSPQGQNGALNRIKQQILKSRKLIQEFKRSQGIKF